MKTTIKIAALLIFLTIFLNCNKPEEYEVFALWYADEGKGPALGPVIGANPNDSIDVIDMFWLLKDQNGKNILVDAGFIDSTHTTKNFIRPDSALLQMNIKPQDISDIIITHPHYDHIGGISLFPNATIWMNQVDYDYFVGLAWKKDSVVGFNEIDVNNILKIKTGGRLKLIKGDNIEFMPGIKAFTGSKHTYENIYLLINYNSEKNKILLASDAIWFYINLERELPVSLCFDTTAYVNAMKRMKTLVTNQNLIIPGHDNKVFEKFPKVNDRIIRIQE